MKRLSLFLVLALALSAMLIACGKNEPVDPSQTECPAIPWAKLGQTVNAPTVFTVKGFDTISSGNTNAYVNANGCENVLDNASDATLADCFNSDKSAPLKTKHANVEANSKIAVWAGANYDKLSVEVRIQMNDNGGQSELFKSPNDKYQFSRYVTEFPVSEAKQDAETCVVYLTNNNVQINGWNVNNMNPSTGEVKEGEEGDPTVFNNNPVTLMWNYDKNTFDIEMTLKGKEAPLVGKIDAFTRISAENGENATERLENKMNVAVK